MPWIFYNSSGQQLRNTGTVLATQAEMEAGTALTSFVTPGRTQYHPGVAKALAGVESDGTALSGNYNISATSTSATGKYTVTLDTDMSSTGYQVVSQVFEGHDTSNPRKCKIQALATGSFGIRAFTEGTSLVDVATLSAVFGDQ